MIAVAARVEEDLLILIFLRVQNVVAETFKKNKEEKKLYFVWKKLNPF